MAKADNIKQLNKIDVKKSTVTINQLEVNDEDFAQYVANAENKEQAVMEVISLGVQTLNTLKNSIEKDFTKQVFKEMSESMDKTLDTTLTSIKDEFNHFFDDEDGAFIKELNTVEQQENIDKLLKMSSEQIQDLLNKDKNVQGYRFTLTSKNIVNSVIGFINLVNKSTEMTSSIEGNDEFDRYTKEGGEMFDRVYWKEVAKDKQKLYKDFFPGKKTAPTKVKSRIKKRSQSNKNK